MTDTVYIISRGRPGNLRRLLPYWHANDFEVCIVVDPRDRQDYTYSAMRWSGGDLRIICPIANDLGLGYARMFAVLHAASNGLDAIVMSDDDIVPASNTNAHLLIESARATGALGVGARVPWHDFSFKGLLQKHCDGIALGDLKEPILCPSGVAFRLFGIHVPTALEHNFDPNFDVQNEDGEYMRCGIAAGTPWMMDPRVEAVSVGGRFMTGGVRNALGLDEVMPDTPEERRALVPTHPRVLACHKLAHEHWPEFVSPPDRPLRTQWAKMYDRYIPGWRKRSALHGGSW